MQGKVQVQNTECRVRLSLFTKINTQILQVLPVPTQNQGIWNFYGSH